MKDVSLFLLKKVFKSRLNWIVLLLFASVLGVTFYLNSQTANSVSLESRLESRIVDNGRAINENEAKLSQMSDTSSEEYQFVKSNLELQKDLLKRKTEILTLLKEGRWKEAYYLQWQDEEKNYEFVSNDPTASSGLKMGVDRERKIYQALYPLNIKAHTLEFPTHGIDQIVWILEAIIPSLFVVAIIFMLTQLFDVLFPGLLLAFLAFIVIVEVVYLIAYFFKQKMPVLFLSLIGIVGLLFGIQTIQPLQRIAHLIPFTYLRSVEILSGRLSKQIDNVDLNWSMGMVLLPCLIILLLVGILFIERWGSSRKKEVFKV